MNQDMEASSILDMPSDIDELEKAKAIESIVLETSAANSCRDDFEESDILMRSVDSSANVTNSLYDADESLKSTDAENGSETAEIKEKDLDPLDGEHSTSINANEPRIEPQLQSKPQPQPQPHVQPQAVASAEPQFQSHQQQPSTPITPTNQVIVSTKPTVNNTVPTSPQTNKYIYVKFIPKASAPSVVVSVPQSPPKSISLATLKAKYDKPFDKVETKKLSPTKISIEEPTTSNVSSSGPPKSVGHTVNLLNNNRILIKSVKNNYTATKSNVTNEALAAASSIQNKDKCDIKHQCDGGQSDVTFNQTTKQPNVTQIQNVDQSDASEVKCILNINNDVVDDSGLEIKKEQLLNENSMESSSDQKSIDAANDEKHLLSAQKIKREFEQLQKTVNESKILSEFVIDHSKRNRRPTKTGKSKHKHNNITDANSSVDDKMSVHLMRSASPSSSSVRSASKESDRSATSTFTSSAGKRNTRSMNTDFSAKQKRFLKGIQQLTRGTDDETDNNSGIDDDDDDLDYFSKQHPNIAERRKSTIVKSYNTDSKSGWDKYCWRCHQHDTNVSCSCCIRSYHANCLKMKILSPSEMNKWQCPECIEIKAAEKENKKKKFDVKHFNKLLKYAMNRILQDPNLQQFQFPVNKTQNPGYSDVIANPINLSKIENNIDNLVYTNSEAFLSDIKWILHNCSIYFSDNKVTRAAKALQKVSKQEVGDIETCPECYLNANTMTDNWFTETCVKPHLILWAKLKGFPYWPAKAMSINSTLVDVRFFGEHDRANIPSKDCYLYSREDPNPPTNKYKRNTIADCVKEVDIYIENIKAKYGAFNYAELKTPFNPQLAEQHLFDMIPGLRTARGRRRSSTARPDLTLKIVKTADNNLSVVKKDQTAKELPPQIKRTVDITGDEAVSRTPTPPSAVLARRKTSDTRIKRSKSTNRHSEGKPPTLDHKSYQVMRRKSMAVEKLDQKRVNVIQTNLDLNSSNESPDVSFVQYNAKSTPEKTETELVAKKTNKPTTKKRKLSIDQVKSNDVVETPEKNMKIDSPKASTSTKVDQPEDKFETNILSSVGLVKKTPAPSQAAENQLLSEKSSSSSNAKVVENKNSTCDTNETNDGAARTQRTNSKDESPVVLVPFIEVKKETEAEIPNVNTGEQTPSSSQTPICLSSSSENTPAKSCTNTEDSLSNIKTETSSDDDSLMIVDDDITSTVNVRTLSKPATSIDELMEQRGFITVRDINKMTGKEVKPGQQHARKSFPKGPSQASILKPRNNAAMNKPAPMNNMVCIPLPRLDMAYSPSQPPPLSVVGSGSSVSLLTQNQSVPTSSTATTNLSNGPPPLSITTMPAVANVSQSSLLNSNVMSTLSNGAISEQMASAVTDLMARRNPPQLTARPTAPLRSEGDTVFPSEAGSVCKTLMENAHKMTDFFRTVIEDTLSDLSNIPNPEARIRILELELEKERNSRQKELADTKTSYERILAELKKSMEKERTRAVNEVRKQCEMERIRSIEEAKRKQWCANCLKEAQFYCCWNTSYCNHVCQRKHWEQHMNTCAQLESAPNMQNSRKTNVKAQSKAELKSQPQSQTQPLPQTIVHAKPQMSGPKDTLNASGTRSGTRLTSNTMVPSLRNILPKNSTVSMNSAAPQTRHSNQVIQSQTKQASNSQCIILSRPLSNWTGSTTKTASLLHSNAIFLPSTQPYATITSVTPSSTSVSLLNTSQSQKPIPSETIIIP